MHEVVPDIHIEVEWDVVDRWSKDASVKLDDAGCLVSEPPCFTNGPQRAPLALSEGVYE